MKILAIDSSGMPASVAVCEDGTLLAEDTVDFKRTHSQTLLPMMDEVKRQLELDLSSVDVIAVAAGPGSFTGLRIGSATAKGIGLALDRPLISVPTLEGMAYNFYGSSDIIVPMMDARRNQVFAGIYTFRMAEADRGLQQMEGEMAEPGRGLQQTEGEMTEAGRSLQQTEDGDPLCVLLDQTPVDVIDLCEKLNRLSEETGRVPLLLGDGASVYHDLIEEHLCVPHLSAPPHLARQKAGSVAVRAMELARQGKLETAAAHRPEYLRVSQAERVRVQKQGGK